MQELVAKILNRTCLMCGQLFRSLGINNRRCYRCSSNIERVGGYVEDEAVRCSLEGVE